MKKYFTQAYSKLSTKGKERGESPQGWRVIGKDLPPEDVSLDQVECLTSSKNPFITIPGIYEPNVKASNIEGILPQHFQAEIQTVRCGKLINCPTDNPVRILLKNCLVEAVKKLHEANKIEFSNNHYDSNSVNQDRIQQNFSHYVKNLLILIHRSLPASGEIDEELAAKLRNGRTAFPSYRGFFTGLANVLSAHRENTQPTMVLTTMTDLPLDFISRTAPPVTEAASPKSTTAALIETQPSEGRAQLENSLRQANSTFDASTL